MKKNKHLSSTRRDFLKKAAVVTAAFTIVPRHVLGRGFISPSDKLNIAVIGGGGKGYSDAVNVWSNGACNIEAICDVDWQRAKKGFDKFPKATRFKDFRKLFESIHNIDAVTVSTPDHTHAVITMEAIKRKKHIYLQKPLTHNIYEARALTKAANKYQIVSQMGNQGASGEGVKIMEKWIKEKKIGKVSLVYVWTNRPVWPQGLKLPKDKPTLLDGLDWDSWIGPAKWVDYHPLYHPFKWRGWWNFGTGALGDMGCHLIDPPYRVLNLGSPKEVECSVTDMYSKDWVPDDLPEACPISSTIQLKFDKTDINPVPVKMIWSDGGLRPFHPDIIPPDHPLGNDDSTNGVIMVGEKGIMTCGTYAANPKIYFNDGSILIDEDTSVKNTLPENGHHSFWTEACKEGFGGKKHKTLTSSFDFAGPLTETILMGNLAIRSYGLKNTEGEKTTYPGRKKLLWDGDDMQITNFKDANKYVRRVYREGWSL